MVEPAPQLGAWGDLAHPAINGSLCFRKTTRPEPIDQNTKAVSADATRMVLDHYALRAKLLHQAHLVLRNLIAQRAADAT
jgi:hypothetical protein